MTVDQVQQRQPGTGPGLIPPGMVPLGRTEQTADLGYDEAWASGPA